MFGSQLKREIRDEMQALLKVQKHEIVQEIHTLRDDLLEVINEEILPQIDECQRDIMRLKVATNLA